MITKFFILLLLLFILALVGVGVILRKIKNFIIPRPKKTKPKQDNYHDNVIYHKDDVVVLKGDANNQKRQDD